MDRVVVIEDGKIREEGSFEQLIQVGAGESFSALDGCFVLSFIIRMS